MTPSDLEKLAEVMARGVIEGTGIDDLDAILITGDQIKAIEAAERAGWRFEAPGGGWQPIETAPKDGTVIWVAFRDDIYPAVEKNRPDVVRWHGVQIAMKSLGIDDWGVAAPVGQSGFPDEWLCGWMPLPEPPK